MTDIVPTTKSLYELQYCPERDEYFDYPPVKKSARSAIEWFCPCKCDSKFISYSQWMRHINLKVHKDYKENYTFLNSHLLEAKSEIKELKRENHQLEAKYMGQNKKYKQIKHNLKENVKKQKELENNINKLKEDNKVLTDQLTIINNQSIISSDSDEDEYFEDCQY